MIPLLLGLALGAPALHLSDLLREARERNPELRAALAEAAAARSSISPAGALDDPMLMLQLWNGPVDFSSVPLMLGISQSFPLGGKLADRREAARADWRASRAGADAAALEIERQVAHAWFDLFMIDRTIEVDREIETTLGAMVEAAGARIVSGKGELVDQLEAQAELLKVEVDEETERARRASVNAKLAALLDRDPGVAIGPMGTPSLLSAIEPETRLREEALARRPELIAAGALVEGARAQVRLAEAARVPDVAVSAAEMHAFGTALSPRDFLFLGVSGNLPIFEREKTQPRIDAAASRLAAVEHAARELHDRVLAEVADARARLVAEHDIVELHHELIPISKQELESAIASYSAGRLEFLTVLDAARQLQAHELDLAAHLGAYEQDLADLEHAVGKDLGLVSHAEGGRMLEEH